MTACRKYIEMQFDYSLSFFCVTKVDMKPKQRVTLTNATRIIYQMRLETKPT